MQSHKEALLASAETTLLTIGGVQLSILGPAVCKPHWNWQRWTLQRAVHTKMSHIAKYHTAWKERKIVVKAITNFINLFDVFDKNNLYCFSTVAPTTKDIEEDLLSVSKVGKEAKSTFIKERLVEVKSFNAPLKCQILKTFANVTKSAKVTGPRKNSN